MEKVLFYDRGIGGSSVPDGNGDTAELGIQQATAPANLTLSKEATLSKESSRHLPGDSAASVSTKPNNGALPTTFIQRQDENYSGTARQRHTGKRPKQLLRRLFMKVPELG